MSLLFDGQMLKSFQLQEASPTCPLIRGSAPGALSLVPAGGSAPRPHYNFELHARHPVPLSLIPGSAPEKVKVKEAYLYGAYYKLVISRRSGMTRVNQGSHIFTSYLLLTPSRGASPHFDW